MLSWGLAFSGVPAGAQSAWGHQDVIFVDMPGRSGRVEVVWTTR